MNKHGTYVSDLARIIDEEIFYFVEEKDLNLSEKELVNKILAEL
ncbi:MAG: hypothetical protein R3279_02100 [Putridiphycobacter sp.]|nr:hypothetical protein [Putridiphycobacter sp.]